MTRNENDTKRASGFGIAIGLLAFATLASAASPPASPATGLPRPPFKGPDVTLWDTWYTVTVTAPGQKKGLHAAYYRDQLKLQKGKIYYRNEVWKKEEGFLNEEQLGALAENTAKLTPIMFNFHSNYRATETNVDGGANGRVLTVNVRKAGQELAPLKKSLAPDAIFSIFFPVWLGYHLDTLKPKTAVSFKTILEDNVEAAFAPVNGSVKLMEPDATARETHTQKLAVDYGSSKTLWWVEPAGAPVRIEAPDQGRVVQRVTRAEAEKFLGDEPGP